MKKFLYLISFLALLLTVACNSNNPKSIAKDFLQAVYSNDMEKVIKLSFTKEELKNKREIDMAKGKMQMMISEAYYKAQDKKGVKSINFIEEDGDDNFKTMIFEVKFKDGSSQNENVKVKKIDKEWKVNFKLF